VLYKHEKKATFSIISLIANMALLENLPIRLYITKKYKFSFPKPLQNITLHKADLSEASVVS